MRSRFEVYAELRDTFAALADRDAVRAVVLTGAGRGFLLRRRCRSHHRRAAENVDREGLLEFTRMTCAVIRNMRALPKPVVAAVNGVAAGAGAVIALACDFRVGTDRSSFTFLFTKVGLAGADMGAAYLLPRTVGLARATEWLMLGEKISAEDARRAGLLSCVVSDDDLMDEALGLATRLASGPFVRAGQDEGASEPRARDRLRGRTGSGSRRAGNLYGTSGLQGSVHRVRGEAGNRSSSDRRPPDDTQPMLDLPLFDRSHRELAARLEAFRADAIEPRANEDDEADPDGAGREVIAACARAGLLELFVPNGSLDLRAICLAREVIASSSGLADAVFAVQGAGQFSPCCRREVSQCAISTCLVSSPATPSRRSR